MASEDVDKLTEALEASANTETEEGEETPEKTSDSEARRDEEGKKTGSRAQERIQELVAKAKSYEEELEALRSTVSSRDTEIERLVNLVSEREADSKAVRAIQELHETRPELRSVIEKLDALVAGKDVDLDDLLSDDKSEKSDKDSSSDARELRKLLNSTKEELGEALADQQAELLLHKIDLLADQYYNALPEDYTDADIKVLQRVVADHIDYDAIEQNPDKLSEKVAEGFQSALDWYGTPRGAVAAKNEAKGGDEGAKAPKQPSPEERLARIRETVEKGATFEEVTTPSGKKIQPAQSHEDFTALLGEALRLSKQAG